MAQPNAKTSRFRHCVNDPLEKTNIHTSVLNIFIFSCFDYLIDQC